MKAMKMLAFLTVLVLSACATSPVVPGAAKDGDRMTHQFPVNGGGAITIVRDKGGSPCDAGVFVSGELSARVGKGERVTLYLPAGRSVVSAHLVGNGLCGIKLQDRGERATALQLAAGDHFTYRLASPGNGVMTITPLN